MNYFQRVNAHTNYTSSPCNFTVLHRPESVGTSSSWYVFFVLGLFGNSRTSVLCSSDCKRYVLVRECATKARVISRLRQRRLRLPPRPPLSFQPPLSESVSLARVFPLLLPLLPLISLLGSFFERQPPSVLISGSSSRCPSYFAGWG